MLDSIHNWFTEGCAAADLIDAKALLGDLARWPMKLGMIGDGARYAR